MPIITNTKPSRISASWMSPSIIYITPLAISNSSIGSRSTLRAIEKILRFFAEGISLYPSDAIRSAASFSDSPFTPLMLFKSKLSAISHSRIKKYSQNAQSCGYFRCPYQSPADLFRISLLQAYRILRYVISLCQLLLFGRKRVMKSMFNTFYS